MANKNETVEEVLAEFGQNIELMRKCKCVGVSLWNCLKFKLRFEAAHRREVEELRECLKEAIELMCKKCAHYNIEEHKCYDGIECQEHDCTPKKWRKALEGANHEGE